MWSTLPQYIQMMVLVPIFAGTQHISVVWDLVLHLVQKTSLQVFPEVIHSSAGGSSYMWSICITMGGGARL